MVGLSLARIAVFCLAALAAFAAAPADAQDIRAMADRLDRLQREVDNLNRQVGAGGRGAPFTTPNPPLSAGQQGAGFSSQFIDRTDQRFSTLEGQVRELTGKLEEITYRLGEISARLDRLMGDIEFRLSAIERGGAGGAAAPSPAPFTAPPAAPSARQSAQALPAAPTGNPRLGAGEARAVIVPSGPQGQAAPPALLPPGTPDAQYDFAYTQLVQAQRGLTDFDRPEQLLRQFVQTHPNHRLAGSAQYWLGETYYARRDFQRAAIAFGEGLTQYPNSDKGPDNLLRLGQSLAALNRNRDACGALGDIERRYPRASQTVRQQATRERQRINCG